MFSRYTFRGRRRANRRTSDPGGGIDEDECSHGKNGGTIVSFHPIDVVAAATLEILSRGGTEANPLMAFLLGHSLWAFLTVKLSGALIAVLILGVHRHFPKVRGLGAVLLAAYGGIALYHLLLLVISAV